MSFDSILSSIAEETDRTALTALAAKYPVLKDAGDTLDRVKAAQPHLAKLKELTGQDFDLAQAAKFATDWQGWAAKDWDREHNATKAELQARALLEETAAKLAELESTRGTEMTNEELDAALDKRFQEAGFVRKDELKTMIPLDRLVDKDGKPIVATKQDLDQYTSGLTLRFEDVFADLLPEAVRHEKMFGESIDPRKVMGVMKEHFTKTGQMMSAAQGYKTAYSEQFSAKEKEAFDKKIADAKAEGIAEGKKAVQQSVGGRAIPIDSRGGLAIGAVARRVQAKIQKDASGKAIEAPLGRGIIAAAAAEEYASKQSGAA